jgi:hypothetical protein
MVTDLDIQPKTKQQSLKCALKNIRLLPDGCCCLNNTRNKIYFRIKWRRASQGFIGPIRRSPLVWGPVTREAKPLARPVQSSDPCKWRWEVDSEEDLISLSLRQ